MTDTPDRPSSLAPFFMTEYDHRQHVDYLLPMQTFIRWSHNPHHRMTAAQRVDAFSTPGLRKGEQTPAEFRRRQIDQNLWTPTREAEWQAEYGA